MMIILAAVIAWFIAQATKLIITLIKTKALDLKVLTSSGGMPSSHTALVIAATTSVARIEGVDSSIFAVCLIFSLVIMYDATNVRRSVGIQAQELNNLLAEFKSGRGHVNNKKVKEILGHTPLEVFGGILLGLAVGFLIS